MKTKPLIELAYKHAHYAGELVSQLYEASEEGKDLDPETVTVLLDQARGLNAAAQSLDSIAHKHPIPANG